MLASVCCKLPFLSQTCQQGPIVLEAVRTMMQIGIHMAHYEGGCCTSWQAIDWHIAYFVYIE